MSGRNENWAKQEYKYSIFPGNGFLKTFKTQNKNMNIPVVFKLMVMVNGFMAFNWKNSTGK